MGDVVTYEIRDAAGELVAYHDRRQRADGTKEFRWRRPTGEKNLGGVSSAALPLYNSQRLASWPDDGTIVVTEGEKAADALTGVGVSAVATVCGANVTPSAETLVVLAGRNVVLWPDNDDAGRAHMAAIAERLAGVAGSVRLASWPAAPAKGDAADYVADHGDPWEIIDAATVLVQPATATVAHRVAERPWPDPPQEARHGLAGAFLEAVEPHSEADPAALLMTFLAAAGATLGTAVVAVAGDALHPPRTNLLTVGDTGKGRKGTSLAPVRRVLLMAQPEFGGNIVSGLSTGEGLIYHVRDATMKLTDVGKGEDRHPELVVTDAGVNDKRLLVLESEFASLLRVMQRDGNSLSAVVRLAWDGNDLSTLTRNSPLRATGAHVAIVGHITRDELIRYLDRSELASGFINRFLVVAARRSRLLPDGDEVPTEPLRHVAYELREAIAWAQTPRRLSRDPAAARIWREIYEDLSAGKAGMLGAATNRAEAQVLRLSVLYAALDRSPEIRAPHLIAALDIWRIASASAFWVFGDATGDTTADAILEAVRARGELTRTDIRDLFQRHTSRAAVERAVVSLVASGRIVVVSEATGGRPREVLRAA